MERKLSISQCMIVKDEEKNIRRALSWGREIMSEQIVVDTGSSDRTVEIAREMGAKVYHFKWIDDFAAAKNYAIDQAKGDWIVFLDADEYLDKEDTAKVVSYLEKLNSSRCHALIGSWVQVDGSEDVLRGDGDSGQKNVGEVGDKRRRESNGDDTENIRGNGRASVEEEGGFSGRKNGGDNNEDRLKWQKSVKADGSVGMALSGTQVRIFRNLPGLRYRGRIHEKLFLKQGELICEDVSREIAIYHTGYTPSEMEEKKKVERNIALVKKELEANPRDYRLMSYLGDSYFQQKKQEEAALWYEQAILHLPRQLKGDPIQTALIFKHLMVIYLDMFREGAALKAYQEGTRRFPQEADYDYLLGRAYAKREQFERGAYHLQQAIGLLDRYGSGVTSALLAHNLLEAWELLTICHYENGNLQQCVSSAVTILKADPWRKETLKALLSAFKLDEQYTPPSQVAAFLRNFYDLQIPENLAFVEETARDAGYERLADRLKQMG